MWPLLALPEHNSVVRRSRRALKRTHVRPPATTPGAAQARRRRCRRQLAARLAGACVCYGRQDPDCQCHGPQAACTNTCRPTLQCPQFAGSSQRRQGEEENSEVQTCGRGRGRGRGQQPDSSDEDEEVGGARTPPTRAPALPCSGTSGSDEDSDEEDDESDSGSSPSLDD